MRVDLKQNLVRVSRAWRVQESLSHETGRERDACRRWVKPLIRGVTRSVSAAITRADRSFTETLTCRVRDDEGRVNGYNGSRAGLAGDELPHSFKPADWISNGDQPRAIPIAADDSGSRMISVTAPR
jgi:hypothetical protein